MDLLFLVVEDSLELEIIVLEFVIECLPILWVGEYDLIVMVADLLKIRVDFKVDRQVKPRDVSLHG